MIKIRLANNKGIAIVDDGFSFLKNYKWFLSRPKNGYALRRWKEVNGTGITARMHHCVIGYPINEKFVDHVNGDTLDNRSKNLRIVTARENQQNQFSHRKGRLVGCYLKDKYWAAAIKIYGKRKYLGRFKTEEEAHAAYADALLAELGKK